MLNNDAWSAVAELAASQHGCFSQQQAADNGIGRKRLDRAIADGIVIRERPRILRFAGAPLTWRGRLWAATHSSGGKASHRAADHLHDPEPSVTPPPLEVTVARGRLPSLSGVVVHRWADPEPELDHVVVDGIPCTNVATTLAQLGAVVPDSVVERSLDNALRRGVSLRWIQETVERLHRPGPSGTGALIRILADERRSGRLPDSWFERLVQRILLAADIPAPRVQHDVRIAGSTYRLDMAWPALMVGLECHSRRYHFGPLKESADHRRDLELAAAGWEVLYMTWEHRRHPDTFVPLLARTLATRSIQLGASAA